MTARTEQAIVVRVEVQVPLPGATAAAPQAVVVTAPPPRRDFGDDFHIDLPQDRPTPVRQVLAQPSMGNICARGRAYRPGATSTVSAKVYQGELNPPGGGPPEVGGSPPAGDVTVKQVATDANGYWEFSAAKGGELFGAQCGPASAGLWNTLAVWARYNNDPDYYTQTAQFTGVCSDHTECAPGSGSGSGSGSGAGAALLQQARQAHAPAPRQWQVVAVGFAGGPVEAFNNLWLLTLCCPVSLPAAWDNGADGHAAPRVELRCEGDWSLTFRSGTCVVRYRKPAGQWQPLNANVFTHAPVVEGDGGKVPPAVTVIPV